MTPAAVNAGTPHIATPNIAAPNLATPNPATPDTSAPANGTTVTVTKVAFVNDSLLNPDDAYRCLINLNINLQNKLYTDKFEWSLLHPAGMAEEFARVTCADLSLGGEWVSAIAHGIYEAVLKFKKEVCEGGTLVTGLSGYGNEIDNLAANGVEAGWRYEPETLCDEWDPKVETLSKEEIERREGDRERQIRRLRRETARFSSTTGITPDASRQNGNYFEVDSGETPLGRGERNKRKRRFRSLSPSGRSGTPGGRGTPDTGSGAGYGGGGGTLSDWYVVSAHVYRNAFTNIYLQGATKLAMQQLYGVGYCSMGCTRWSRRSSGTLSLYILQ
jgi:chromatin structure-remodeling complex subunit SFH1